MDVELNTRNLMVGGNFRAVVVAITQRFCLISLELAFPTHRVSSVHFPDAGS